MDSIIGGKQNQPWVSRGALDRNSAKIAWGVAFVFGALAAVLIGALAYVASLPREVPVIIAQQRDGSYAPYAQNLTPDAAGEKLLVANWFGAFRLGDRNVKSYAARQTAALVPAGDGAPDEAAQVVRSYNEQIAESGAKVVPTIRDVSCVNRECQVDWDEAVTLPKGETTQHAMRAWVSIAYDQARQSLHNDPLTNPYGLYLTKIRIVEVR